MIGQLYKLNFEVLYVLPLALMDIHRELEKYFSMDIIVIILVK